jgi:hypothetical protein
LTIGSFGAEEICPSSQTCAQLLRRVIKVGRRTIRCLVSHRSSVAPTVRPTLIFFDRRFIRRYTKAWVPPVIKVRRRFLLLTLIHFARRHQRPSAAFALAAGDSWRRTRAACSAEPPSIPPTRRWPPRLSTALIHVRHRHHPPRVWLPPRFPAKRRHLGSPAFTAGCARL